MLTAAEKLNQLRQLMAAMGIDYYFIPSRDEHNNEYVPACWQRRCWLTGFDGSAGDVMVTPKEALLWTDSRYFLQAEQQLDSTLFQLMKLQPGSATLNDWLANQPANIRVGVDPKLISIKQAAHWQAILTPNQSQLIALPNNLIDELWLDRPSCPAQLIRLQPEALAGSTLAEKVTKIRKNLTELQADAHVIVSLDALAWLFNIRGSDIDYNPLVIAYGLVTQQEIYLFIDLKKLTQEVAAHLQQQSVQISSYDQFAEQLAQLSGSVLLDSNASSWWVSQQIQSSAATLILAPSPITLMKAIKNLKEQEGMRAAHVEDAIALIRFFCWLEHSWRQGITELTAAEQLNQLRMAQTDCVGLSFETISAFAEHGAIVHYRVTEDQAKIIDDSNLYLVDSGGQYINGTTDVTRTIHLGTPTSQQKYHYTLVLKGHLALSHTVFPSGTCGFHLDSLARQFLWQAGLDYGHGTGHGIGCHLCVHEGPQSISPMANPVALQSGMMVSNEPGIYLAGEYGIRIENVCQVVSHRVDFNALEDLTWVPYARNLIETHLLTPQEIRWINEYHQKIYQQLSPRLRHDEQAWLMAATKPLG